MIDVQGIFDKVESHAAASGWFDTVNSHEPKSPPGHGLAAAVWVQHLGPAILQSGLSSTTALLVLNVRLYSNMLQEPQDAIDPNLTMANTALFAAYTGDFDLGGLARCIDVLGMTQSRLSSDAGYLTLDGTTYRVFTITVPVIINDAWPQRRE